MCPHQIIGSIKWKPHFLVYNFSALRYHINDYKPVLHEWCNYLSSQLARPNALLFHCKAEAYIVWGLLWVVSVLRRRRQVLLWVICTCFICVACVEGLMSHMQNLWHPSVWSRIDKSDFCFHIATTGLICAPTAICLPFVFTKHCPRCPWASPPPHSL